MLKKFSLPRGTSDILPEEVTAWQDLERVLRQELRCYAYREIRTPVFEETGLFVRSIGQTTDVVQKQMLQLAAQGANGPDCQLSGLALRPEGTAAVVRAYIEHNIAQEESLSKFYYISPMFRGERPQKGRLRQFHQVGVEAIGPKSCHPYLDAEVVSLSVRLLNVLGLKNFQLKINSLGTADDKSKLAGILREKLQSQKKDLCEDCRNRFERNVFRILDCKHRGCQNIVRQLDLGYQHLSVESRDYFERVCAALDDCGVSYVRVPAMVRGLDYYTHMVFELSDPALGSQDALGAGGRYNNLVADLGGPAAEAIGFALGLERILLSRAVNLAHAVREPEGIFFIALDDGSMKQAAQIMRSLRHQGWACDMSYRLSSLKSQMRQAGKARARLVVILGEDEIRRGVITLKDMVQGGQKEVPFSEVNNEFAQILKDIKERQ